MPTHVTAPTTIYDTRFDHETAMVLAAEEYSRFADTLLDLVEEDWRAPTACPGWTIRDMAGHTLGMAELAASLPEMARQLTRAARAAKRSGKPDVDELTAHQIRKHEQLSVPELVDAFRAHRTQGCSRPPTPTSADAGDEDHRPRTGRREPGALEGRIPDRHDSDARPVDAPQRHRPRARSTHGTDPRTRRRPRCRRGHGMGPSAQTSLRPHPDGSCGRALVVWFVR